MTRQHDASKLIEHIHASQAGECQRILDQACEQARAIIKSARRAARQRVHQTVAHERQLLAREEILAHARLHTAERSHVQKRQRALLSAAMEMLEAELKAQWQQQDAAAAWITRACHAARDTLPDGDWQLEHGEDWSELHRDVCGGLIAPPGWHETLDPSIDAGLRVKCQGVVVDATLKTILQDRRLQGDLLSALDVHNCEVPAGHG